MTECERVQFHAPITGDAARTALTPRRRAHHVPHCARAQRFPHPQPPLSRKPFFPKSFPRGTGRSPILRKSHRLLPRHHGAFQGFSSKSSRGRSYYAGRGGVQNNTMFFTTSSMPPLRRSPAFPHPQPPQQFSFPKLSPQNRLRPQHCTKRTALRPAAPAFPEALVSSRITQYFFIAARQAVRLPTRRAYTLLLFRSTASTVSAISVRPNSAAAIRPRANSAAPSRNASVRPSASCRGEKSES